MGRKVDFLAGDKHYRDIVAKVARQQFARRRRAYNELAIFEARDLAQELWCSLLEREQRGHVINAFIATGQDFKEYLVTLADILATKGRRKAAEGCSVAVSDLEDGTREYIEDLYYSQY